MTDEIRRRKTQDPELDAIVVVSQALAPLDQSQARRVVEWADQRYVNPKSPVPIDGMKSITKFMEAMETVAREMSISPPAKILDAMTLVVAEMREQKKLEAAG